jgi:hypothetical protein
MKLKIAIAGALLSLTTVCTAVEVGIVGAYDYGLTTDRSGVGVTVGEKFGRYGVTAGVERYTENVNQVKYSLVNSYDLVKVLGSVVSVRGGAVYMDNSRGADGFAWVAGFGAAYPVTKELSLTYEFRHQIGQDRVKHFDGNTSLLGVKYAF